MYNKGYMANIKSAIKRISVTKTKQSQNRPVKTHISGEIKKPFVIDTDKCIKCGACMAKCKFGAIEKK